MHDKTTDVQDSFKKAYVEFLKTKDMSKYNNDIDVLFEKHRNDSMMLNFCKSLLVAWAPIIQTAKDNSHERKSRITIKNSQGGRC